MGITIIIKKAGKDSSNLSKGISLIMVSIKNPTMIKAGAVASLGTIPAKGEKKKERTEASRLKGTMRKPTQVIR
jgi:hypothetical protein